MLYFAKNAVDWMKFLFACQSNFLTFGNYVFLKCITEVKLLTPTFFATME